MKRSRLVILFIIAACIVSRLPVLSGTGLMDGDECVVAMMAKHTMEGEGIPMFFYGQDYGFAFIEVLSMIPFFLFGISTLTAKLAMLSLWTVGVVFFYLTLKRIARDSHWLPLLTTLLLVVSPAWAAFSMKALGGYITAFTLSNIVLYLLFSEKEKLAKVTYTWIGILLAIIFQAQILWLPGLLPFVLYRLWRDKKHTNVMYLLIPVMVITTAFYCYKVSLPTFSTSSRFNPKDVLPEYIARIPQFIHCTMHGKFALWKQGDPSTLESLFAWIMTGLVLLTPVVLLAYSLRSKAKWILVASASSVGLCLMYTMFTYHIQGRYLLPVIAYALLAFFLLLYTLPVKRAGYIILTALLVPATICISIFREFQFPNTDPASQGHMINSLESSNVRHVYCTDGMLAWQIIFYSKEKIIARPAKYPGRYKPYGKEIDSVYLNGGNTAVVGYTDADLNDYNYGNAKYSGGLFIETNVKKERLEKYFEFKEGTLYPVYK